MFDNDHQDYKQDEQISVDQKLAQSHSLQKLHNHHIAQTQSFGQVHHQVNCLTSQNSQSSLHQQQRMDNNDSRNQSSRQSLRLNQRNSNENSRIELFAPLLQNNQTHLDTLSNIYQLQNTITSNRTPKYYEGTNLLRQSDQNGMSLLNDEENDNQSNQDQMLILNTDEIQEQQLHTNNNLTECYEQDDMLDELEDYDSHHRSKTQLPEPHPHQNQPLPIVIMGETTTYNHFAPKISQQQQTHTPIESHHKNHNVLLDCEDDDNDDDCNDNDIQVMQQYTNGSQNCGNQDNEQEDGDHEVMVQMVKSFYHTGQSLPYHKYNQRITNEYHSNANQTKIVDHSQQIYEDESLNIARSPYQSQSIIKNQNANSSSDLYVWGRNQNGQLGIEPTIKSVVKIPHILKLDFQISQISCGKSHTALVTTQGSLYTMGSNLKGQLGLGSAQIKYLSSPELVEALSMWKCEKVVCARNSTFALMSSQQQLQSNLDLVNNINNEGSVTQQYLFSWGSDKNGVLGLGNIQGNQYFPIKIVIDEENEENIEIIDINAGRSHVGAIIKKKQSLNNENDSNDNNCLYMWGQNNYGQLGLWDFDNRNVPTFVDSDFNPTQVSCGDSFTICLTDQNTLYSAGSNLQGQLGQGQSINKQNVFAQINTSKTIQIQNGQYIKQLQTSDYAGVIVSNGDMYIWGPTPIGQFNSPQMLQDLIQNNSIQIRDMSLGTSFGLIQDENMQSYQLGSLFQENKGASSNFQYLENMYFLKFQCGHDFVIASAIPNTYNSNSVQKQGNKSTQKQNNLIRSNTQSALAQHQKNFIKLRQPSVQQQQLPQILSQSHTGIHSSSNNNGYINSNNYSPSPLRISTNNINNTMMTMTMDMSYLNNYNNNNNNNNNNPQKVYQNNLNNTTHKFQNHQLQQQQQMCLNNYNRTSTVMNLNSTLSNQQQQQVQSYNSRHVNNNNGNNNIINTKTKSERKHLDSCTPVRNNNNNNIQHINNQNDKSPMSNKNINVRSCIQQKSQQQQQQLTPSQANTPNNMRLRLQNTQQQMNHLQSYAASNVDDLLSQTLMNTPQHMRRTFAGQPHSSLLTHHQQQNLTATPPPFNNYINNNNGGNNNTNCGCGPNNINNNHNHHNNMCLSQSYGFNHMLNGGMSQSLIFQSIDQHQTPHNHFNQTQHSLYGNNNQQQLDLLIREKQELNHQMQVEIQRRLMQEKELQEAFRQLETINNQHQTNIHELTEMLDLTKRDNDSLLQQVEEQEQEIQAVKNENLSKDEELNTLRQMYEELQQKQSGLMRENEYLKQRAEVAQQFQQLSQQANSTNTTNQSALSLEKLKDLEETLQRKNKELYDLTVQLGMLTEQNNQLAKDLSDAEGNFRERLEDQKMRADAEIEVMFEENQQLKKENDEFKSLIEEKDNKIEEMEKQIEKLDEEIVTKDDNIKIHKREISILQSEQDKLMKEYQQLQQQLQQQEQQNQKQSHKSSKSHSRHGSITIKNPQYNNNHHQQNKKALHLSTILQDVTNNTVSHGDVEFAEDMFDIEDLRKAADEILKDKHIFKTQTSQQQQSKQKSNSKNNHQHQHTQILINPIETPMESQRDSAISMNQPMISAQVISQQHLKQTDRQSLNNVNNAYSSSQMTPKQMMYQQLKQSMGFGKDSRAISNREQGCLQVANTQRRKSTQGFNYNNQVKNLRSSKSGTNLKSTKAAVSSRLSHNNMVNSTTQNINNQNATMTSYMNKTDMNIHTSQQNLEKTLITQRGSVQNISQQQHNKSPINLKKKNAHQIKIQKNINRQGIEIIDNCGSGLDSLLTSSQSSQQNKTNNQLNKSPLRQIQNSSSNNNLHQTSKQKTPLSSMHMKHNLHHQDTSKNRFSNNYSRENVKQQKQTTQLQIDENTTPTSRKQQTVTSKNENKSLTTTQRSIIQQKSLMINTSVGNYNGNGNTIQQSAVCSTTSSIPNTQSHTPKEIISNNSNGSLTDMKHKLQDIQQNKQYLEKKIYEYERKLNELKGLSSQNQNSSSLNGTDKMMQMTMSYGGNMSLGKQNTLSAAIFEKVLSDNRK